MSVVKSGTTDPSAIGLGNILIGNDPAVDYGPTSATGFWNSVTIVTGSTMSVQNKASGGPSFALNSVSPFNLVTQAGGSAGGTFFFRGFGSGGLTTTAPTGVVQLSGGTGGTFQFSADTTLTRNTAVNGNQSNYIGFINTGASSTVIAYTAQTLYESGGTLINWASATTASYSVSANGGSFVNSSGVRPYTYLPSGTRVVYNLLWTVTGSTPVYVGYNGGTVPNFPSVTATAAAQILGQQGTPLASYYSQYQTDFKFLNFEYPQIYMQNMKFLLDFGYSLGSMFTNSTGYIPTKDINSSSTKYNPSFQNTPGYGQSGSSELNRYLILNGTTQRVQLDAGTLNFGTSAFTICMWYCSSGAQNQNAILWSGGYWAGAGTDGAYALYITSGASNVLQFSYSLGSGYVNQQTSYNVNDGKWHLIVLTRNGTTGIVYVDGTNVFNFTTPSSAMGQTGSNSYIGYNVVNNALTAGNFSCFWGYTYDLTATQVSTLFTNTRSRYGV